MHATHTHTQLEQGRGKNTPSKPEVNFVWFISNVSAAPIIYVTVMSNHLIPNTFRKSHLNLYRVQVPCRRLFHLLFHMCSVSVIIQLDVCGYPLSIVLIFGVKFGLHLTHQWFSFLPISSLASVGDMREMWTSLCCATSNARAPMFGWYVIKLQLENFFN